MKEIELTQGQITLIDDEDFKYLNQWNWWAAKRKNTYYAARSKKVMNKENQNKNLKNKIF